MTRLTPLKRLSQWGRWLGAISLGLLLGMTLVPSLAIGLSQQSLEEAPGQMLYQVRETLRDQEGHSWQAIAFQRVTPADSGHLYLRLAGFPGVVSLERGAALELWSALGDRYRAPEDSTGLFTPGTPPTPHIGQYDLGAIVADLRPELPLRLSIPNPSGDPYVLKLSPQLVQAWQGLAPPTSD